MGMKVIFSFQVAKDDRIRKGMGLASHIDFVQGFIQNLNLFIFELDYATHKY